MKHKHYNLIVAWAAGEKIEVLFHGLHGKTLWVEEDYPEWHENVEYRLAKKEISWKEVFNGSFTKHLYFQYSIKYYANIFDYPYYLYDEVVYETSSGNPTNYVPV